ncbi:PucR family transcriptional regulator ligand-binding domain-containing protein [Sinomonas sp. JGH33]|uniref:PucR family transcriptional regulator ligand-binding domain-containing protein n=1 Tax=Sinomonas terricola TaxID=3110330 RepID=A0ABU5T1S6_9MICC|nr:PucR family transcriptional regulator ligand-binding domain-containing protein [Sinomonas sp. JGH33]MEA5453617.1 PucR family transcriptional regulator ligand-binding domain-containing protein [Sinomonas sp. JGH33]
MALTLSALLSAPGLGLSLAGSATSTLEREIAWVAVTEQENPAMFLTGGELVLTTGVRQRTAEEQRRFVRVLQRAGAVGIGFGVGLGHDTVPAALVAEANRWGLPVIEVPYQTPFIALGKLVADSHSADHFAKLERLIADHQVLARSLLTGGGLPELLKHLGGMLGTELVLTQFTAELYSSSKDAGAPTMDRWVPFPVPTGRRDACTLWAKKPFDDSGIVGYAQNLISIELNNLTKQRQAQRALAGQVMADVVRGALDTDEASRRLAGVGVNSTRRNVVLLAESAAHHKNLRGTTLPATLDGAVSAMVDHDLVVVVEDDGGRAPKLARNLADHLVEAGIHATIGIGGSYTKPNGLRWSYFESKEAAARGLEVNEPERLSLTSLLLSSEDVPLADMAGEAIGPLVRFDKQHGSELVHTLEAYLNLNGSVAAVADELSLHRNTVRYRLAQIAELTGYDPAVTADRVQLYLALAVRRVARA